MKAELIAPIFVCILFVCFAPYCAFYAIGVSLSFFGALVITLICWVCVTAVGIKNCQVWEESRKQECVEIAKIIEMATRHQDWVYLRGNDWDRVFSKAQVSNKLYLDERAINLSMEHFKYNNITYVNMGIGDSVL